MPSTSGSGHGVLLSVSARVRRHGLRGSGSNFSLWEFDAIQLYHQCYTLTGLSGTTALLLVERASSFQAARDRHGRDEDYSSPPHGSRRALLTHRAYMRTQLSRGY